MTSALNVAEHILRQMGPMTGLKLQKLVYYSQVWHLVWEEKALFSDPIEGWRNGPVVPALWELHKGRASVDTVGGDPGALTDEQREVIDSVLVLYGQRPSEFLSSLTHEEYPWRRSRRELGPDDPGNEVITLDSMIAFYEQATPGGEGMDLHMTHEDVEAMVRGQAEFERGEFVSLDDLERGLQGQAS